MTELERVVDTTRSLRPRTKELYLRCIRAYLEFAGETSEEWTKASVSRWRDSMKRRGMEPQSVNASLFAVRFAARRLKSEFADQTKTLEVVASKRKRRSLSFKEAEALVKACIGPRPRDLRDTAICVLGLHTGMLRFSMCQICIKDLSGDELTFTRKGGAAFTIPLDAQTLKAIRVWTAWLKDKGVDSGPVFRSLSRRLVDTPTIGNELTPDGLYRAVQQRAEKADLGNLSPLIFRRTFLAWATKSGAEPFEIALVTGYRSDGPLEIPQGKTCKPIAIPASIGP
jgi:integrase